MPIIDSQVHAYEANTPKRPWRTVPNWPDHVTGDEMVAAMDKVGVDGTIFVSPFAMYGYDASYAVAARIVCVAADILFHHDANADRARRLLPVGDDIGDARIVGIDRLHECEPAGMRRCTSTA